MNTTETYRRAIVLPLNCESLRDIQEDNISSSTNVLIIDLQEKELFYKIWATGIFETINKQYGIIIDDYEEECLQQVNGLSDFIENFSNRKNFPGDIKEFFQDFHNIALEAEKIRYPLYFVF